jgi:tetratricopeptide (TPR) repeat protein
MPDTGSGTLVPGQPVGGAKPLARLNRAAAYVKGYFAGEPTFAAAVAPALVIGAIVFLRSPLSNYIFDEQEALLANPYVNGGELGYFDAFRRDFWGLPPGRSIGSYRPVPNLVWRALWQVSQSPWLLHFANIVVHAVNAALVASFSYCVTQRRNLGWLAGGTFLCTALLTEAVTGVVGLADVLGGLAVLLSLQALRLRSFRAPLGVFAALCLGLFSKESVLVAVPLVAWAALVTAPVLHRARPARLLRLCGALLAAAAALVLYTYVRRHLFMAAAPNADGVRAALGVDSLPARALNAFLGWFQQPRLPADPMNNPLVLADVPHRIAGALRVYVRGLGQLAFPWRLSGDYSFPAEPVPTRLVFPESVLGALLMVLPVLGGLALFGRALVWERRHAVPKPTLLLVILGLIWVPLAYLPHSNILVVLPTVRAERFWYLPAIGAALLAGAVMAGALDRAALRLRKVVVYAVVACIGFQALRARVHALNYSNDLAFWRATRSAVPNSAKAHLNYSVMVGARGRLDERLEANQRAIELAPRWPMAHIYYGDTLCRMHRANDAWVHYVRGFELGPNESSLIALALQCLWVEKALDDARREQLFELVARHRGSWLAYLGTEVLERGEVHGGVPAKHRARGYNEGPKKR